MVNENEVSSLQERAAGVWIKLITGSTAWERNHGKSSEDGKLHLFEDRKVLGTEAAPVIGCVVENDNGDISVSVSGKLVYLGPTPDVQSMQRLRATVERVERADIDVVLPEGNVLDHDSIWRMFNSTATDLACDQVKWEPARSYKLVGVCNDPEAPPPRVCFLVHP